MKSFRELGISLDVLLSKLDDLIQVIDRDGNYVYVNRKWQQRLDYNDAQLETLNFFDDVLESPYRSLFMAQFNQLKIHDAVSDVQGVLKSHLGKEVPIEGHIIKHQRAEGDIFVCIFHQVVHRQQRQTDLERMFAMSVDMLGIADFEGTFIYLNPAWERVLGYSLDELVGQPFLSFVHPQDRLQTSNTAIQTQVNNDAQTFENRYICKDGTIKWLSWHYISYPDIQQTYFVARDISNQHHDQLLLQEARDQLQAILDNSGTMIGLKNLAGQYILVNQEFADIFAEGDNDQLLGKTDAEIFSASIASILLKHDQLVLESQRSLQFEENISNADGTRTYLTTRFLLNDKDDNPYAICMIAKDITYRKLTEMQLLMRNQAIEYSPTGISIADARLPDLPLIYINPSFEHTTGYSALDAIGRNCRFLQGDDRDQEGVKQLRHAIKNEQPATVIIRNYRKNGEMFYNELNIAPIHNNEGQLTHYVGISTDVTKRIHADEKIQKQNNDLVEANADLARARKDAERATQLLSEQNHALIAANRDLAYARRQAEDATHLKSQFLATMSHELRTPLNAIIGYTEIQLAGMTGEITEEQRDYQERVVTNADHLLNLINDVLDISKIEAGRLELVNKVFHLRDWVADVDNQMRVLAEEKSLDFSIAVDARMPDEILGDPARIKQIVINLLSNAIKFTEAGTVRMLIRKHGRDAWHIVVEDTGMGIPSHMQETIFEEFRQVDSSSRRKTGGTGLGLAIVRKLLLMMGGTVRLTSQVNEGSTFTITLPFQGESHSLSATNTGEPTHD
ncbi:MAG: PAS domain S-box protein [Phototrophicaceae bacterium]